jgi:hypothetical protein
MAVMRETDGAQTNCGHDRGVIGADVELDVGGRLATAMCPLMDALIEHS